MSKKLICPNCEMERLVEPVHEKRIVEVKGEPYPIQATLWRCLHCKEELEDPNNPVDELDLAYRAYRKTHNMLQPEEIKQIRETMGLTQIELANLLGWSPATLSRYENGALQEYSHDFILQSFKNPAQHLSRLLECHKPDIYSGNVSFNLRKYLAVICCIIQICPGTGVPKTKLNKLLFYSDFLHFDRYGKSITGTRYLKMPYGPCPKDFQSLLGLMADEGSLEIEEKETSEGYEAELVKIKMPIDEEILTEKERAVIEKVCRRFGNSPSARLSEWSHQEKGYQLTRDREPISYEYASYLNTQT
ncbi:MAG: DUF4065 domain-containing protein [Deltaproteobacteria bacterium]|nr:DUF4065 domain-containing protein [Deltaproteobacteria bacterium]